ncbi:MAG: thiopeptide-type bacteriocin biosynthesis protein [Acidimicrobiales bacterium]
MSPRTGWRSWHLHTSNLDPTTGDEVVRRVVGPAIDRLHDEAPGTAWFYLRYWQGGPHIRLRLAGVGDEPAARVERQLRCDLAAVTASIPTTLTPDAYLRHAAPLAAAGEAGRAIDIGELRSPGVYDRRYEPEFDRYGGAPLLAVSESLFAVSSQLSLAFLRRHPSEAARSGLGLQATRAALSVVGDDERRRGFCRRAGAGWQAWAARADATTTMGKFPPPLSPRHAEVAIPTPVRQWVDHLAAAMDRWRRGIGEENAQRILYSHIHLLHNRLGLGVGHEFRHYQTLAVAS